MSVKKKWNPDVAVAGKNWQAGGIMRTGFASLRALTASFLAVALCVVSAWPARAITANTSVIPSAVTVTKETAYRGVLVVVVEPCTGLFGADNPVNRIDPSGNDDIGDLMVGMDISAGLDALPNLTTIQGALSGGNTCGPDITVPLMNAMNDVEQTYLHAPYATKVNAAANVLTHPYNTMVGGWDVDKLVDLGYGGFPNFGNGSSLGNGDVGIQTVQFGNPPKVYYAGSVNYIIWGRMFSLFHDTFRNPISGAGDPLYSESAAVAGARTWKALGHHDVFDKYATEAGAFVKFGYSATDPSSTALPIAPNSKNVADPARFKWKWLGLRNDFE